MNKTETEKLQEQKPTIREPQFLGHYSTPCPYCRKAIYIPKYRLYPRTYEEARDQDRILAKNIMAKNSEAI